MSLWLGCVYPAPYPVRAVWTARTLEGCLGHCQPRPDKGYFEVCLRPGLSRESALTTLLHEWAHARTMLFLMEGESPHSSRFWLTLGEMDGAWHGSGASAAKRLFLRKL